MKTLYCAAITLLAILGVSPLPLVGADYDRYQTLAADDVSVELELACPRYALHDDYSRAIDLEQELEEEPGLGDPPVEIVEVDPDPDGGPLPLVLFRIDMTHYLEAHITVWYWSDPYGWITNLGNSRTNNGCGGDGATSSFDGEFWVIQPPAPPHPPFDYDLGAETNDFGYQAFPWGVGRAAKLRVRNLFEEGVGEDDLTPVTYVVRDKSLRVASSAGPVEPEFAGDCVFRIDTALWDPEANDQQGACNDGVLWLGLNRVVASIDRHGQGAVFAVITLIGSGLPPVEEEAETE